MRRCPAAVHVHYGRLGVDGDQQPAAASPVAGRRRPGQAGDPLARGDASRAVRPPRLRRYGPDGDASSCRRGRLHPGLDCGQRSSRGRGGAGAAGAPRVRFRRWFRRWFRTRCRPRTAFCRAGHAGDQRIPLRACPDMTALPPGVSEPTLVLPFPEMRDLLTRRPPALAGQRYSRCHDAAGEHGSLAPGRTCRGCHPFGPLECGIDGRPSELLMFCGGDVFVGVSDVAARPAYELEDAPRDDAGYWRYVGTLTL